MFGSLLVPLDGSDHALLALDLAVQLASGDAPKIHLITVPEVPPTAEEMARWAGASPATNQTDVEKEAQALLDKAKADIEAKAREKNIEIDASVAWSPPAVAITSAAEELGVEAIVMGSRGLGEFKSLLLGSVSHKVLHTAECRVILIR